MSSHHSLRPSSSSPTRPVLRRTALRWPGRATLGSPVADRRVRVAWWMGCREPFGGYRSVSAARAWCAVAGGYRVEAVASSSDRCRVVGRWARAWPLGAVPLILCRAVGSNAHGRNLTLTPSTIPRSAGFSCFRGTLPGESRGVRSKRACASSFRVHAPRDSSVPPIQSLSSRVYPNLGGTHDQ